MKLKILIILLLYLPNLCFSLNPEQIKKVSQTVVQIHVRNNDGEHFSGSGVIVHKSGIIYTNYHVVENAEKIKIYMNSDNSEKPLFSYYAEILKFYIDVDFAILQVSKDKNNEYIDLSLLELPYIKTSPAQINRLDEVYVFGFPGIGGGYLVSTSGRINSIIQNEINNIQKLYLTDAEFSPGSSGGPVINENMEFVGITTWIIKEDYTGGRLGAILSAHYLDYIKNNYESDKISAVQQKPLNPKFQVKINSVDSNYVYDSEEYIKINLSVEVIDGNNIETRVAVFFSWDDGDLIYADNTVPEEYKVNGLITVQGTLNPIYDHSIWEEYLLYFPKTYLPKRYSGNQKINITALIGKEGENFTAESEVYSFNLNTPNKNENSLYGSYYHNRKYGLTQESVDINMGGDKLVKIESGYYFTSIPTYILQYYGQNQNIIIHIMVDLEYWGADVFLLVKGPDTWYYNEYSSSIIRIDNPVQGEYLIWAGNKYINEYIPGKLSILLSPKLY